MNETYDLYPWAKDAAGNISAVFAAPVHVLVDATPPDTQINSQPSTPSNSSSAAFTFSSPDDPTATFECSLNDTAFSVCVSGQNYSNLVNGSYTFQVRATDAAGNVDPTPASYTWDVLVTVSISGHAGIAGATITYTGGSMTANSSGDYSFTVAYGWSGTVTPSKTGYRFTPTNKTYSNVTADQTAQNYTAAQITYTISGNAYGAAVLSYTVNGVSKSAVPNSNGNYSFTVPYGWSGTVTPSMPPRCSKGECVSFYFTPSRRSYSNVLANQTSQNYTVQALYSAMQVVE